MILKVLEFWIKQLTSLSLILDQLLLMRSLTTTITGLDMGPTVNIHGSDPIAQYNEGIVAVVRFLSTGSLL